ncbi:SAF domain protein [Corynebacterium occultum]|uniref:SAF domain protein n=1 Tax=Corynebacterium occultum TaxID=2675219 RepID=A0A6B8WJZ7_9CORY|nr:SAF domain-containing protein [Corynebacterium occultum]QGU06768.1 SAF domain protein [Corynebacterium occultum]
MKLSTSPTVLNTLRTPGWHRTLLLRRAAAVVLVLLAVWSMLHNARDSGPRALVVARDIAPGSAVSASDFEMAAVPPHLLPEDALQDPEVMAGKVAATTLKVGQVPSEASFIGSALLAELIPESQGEAVNLVPLRLAEPEVITLLQHGDTVTVLSQPTDAEAPEVVASGARVVLAESGEGNDPATVLVALPETEAQQVAVTALYSPLAVVLTGDRANKFP